MFGILRVVFLSPLDKLVTQCKYGLGTRGGPPDLIGWGCHWTSKCMGHIESKIKNLKGLWRVFARSICPIFFTGAFAIIKMQTHRLYTNYLFSYFRKYILQYSFFEQTPIRPI